jgi:HPt (histidine-containing phosphotransfer) domain-containing protein
VVLDRTKLRELRRHIGEENTLSLLRIFEADACVQFPPGAEHARSPASLAADAHSFGGSASMLGFHELTQACQNLEASARNREGLIRALDQCRASRDRALDELSALRLELAARNGPAATA